MLIVPIEGFVIVTGPLFVILVEQVELMSSQQTIGQFVESGVTQKPVNEPKEAEVLPYL